jgi:hypothetical protein
MLGKPGHVSSISDHYALERVDAYYLRKDRTFDLIQQIFSGVHLVPQGPCTIRQLLDG